MTGNATTPGVQDDEGARLLERHEFVLGVDYGSFTITTDDGGPWAGDLQMDLLHAAFDRPPSASDEIFTVVLTPHHHNFFTPFALESWSSRPPVDHDDWQQVSQHEVEVGALGSVTVSSSSARSFPCDPGDYVIEVAGRGFVPSAEWEARQSAREWDVDDEVPADADSWRIRLWPPDGLTLEPSKIYPHAGIQPDPQRRD